MRIFTYVWHFAHQYELCKLTRLGYKIDMLVSEKKWDERVRPFPSDVIPVNTFDPEEYDLLIICGDHWRFPPYAQELINTNKPKIFLMHGYTENKNQIEMIKKTVKDDVMVVNSKLAEEVFKANGINARFILHGMEPEEWELSSYEKATPVNCSPMVAEGCNFGGDLGLYYGCDIYKEVTKYVKIDGISNASSFEDYKSKLRQYSIYFNPTRYSPNPRGRAEAMHCGLVPVSTCFHYEENYIEHGVSGFLSNDPKELVEYLNFLINNIEVAKEMGLRAREVARKYFNLNRYLNEWDSLIKEIVNAFLS